MMRAVIQKRAKREIVHEGEFLRFIRQGEWEYVERSNCSAIAIILATTENDKVLFVEQYRVPVGRKVIELPAGLINDQGSKMKESIMSGAQRELLEETGYKANKMKKILEGPVSSGSSGDMVTVFWARDVRKVSKGGGDNLESIIVHAVPIKTVDQWLKKMKLKGFLIEPKIYAGLYFLKTYNK